MPCDLLKPCVLFFLRKIARNYSIVTHKKSWPIAGRQWLIIPKTFFTFDVSLFLFRACDMLIFSRCLHSILCGIWYDISCERNSSVSRVTSLDLVKSVSTASKGLINNYWGGWVEAETWCFRRSGVYHFENHVAGLIHNRIVPWNGNLHKSWLPLAYVKPCSPSRRRKNLLRRFSFFLEEGTDTRRLRDHLYQWLSWAR